MLDARRIDEEFRRIAEEEGRRALLRLAVEYEARAADDPEREVEWILLAGAALESYAAVEGAA